ncbi:hypothetical protein [Bizionia arctica]|uniref:Uncharacterized protein n=1 Tax=Bizionia arctica TaxID=1495645 RepID=A0A917GNL0_9FLAO|nr:hypothetical protein [Bizionia arctica]GGG51998.1 hypothetical protein GCM10010976_23930 [Bizionia arctica]
MNKLFRLILILTLSTTYLLSCKSPNKNKTEIEIGSEELTERRNLESLLIFKSQEELEEVFGKENVKKELSSDNSLGSGENYSKLFPNTDNEISFFWKNTESLENLDFIKISENNNLWSTNSGLRIGMSINEIEKINQNPFVFDAFEKEIFKGNIEWQNGTLEKSNIIARISPPKFEDGRVSSALEKKAFELEFSSSKKYKSSSRAQSYDMYLSEIILRKE